MLEITLNEIMLEITLNEIMLEITLDEIMLMSLIFPCRDLLFWQKQGCSQGQFYGTSIYY